MKNVFPQWTRSHYHPLNNVNILKSSNNVNILKYKCIGDGSWRFWPTGDPRLPETVSRRQESGFAEKNLPPWSDLNETFLQWTFFCCPISGVFSQPCLPETIDCSVSSCFMNTKMTSNIINVDTSFRHANYSDSFVSGRLPRFQSFHQISVTCWCVLPSDLVSMF